MLKKLIKFIRVKAVNSQRGMTLIEAVIGIALLSVVVVAVLTGVSTTFKANALADRQSTAVSLVMSQVESLQLEVYKDAPSGGEVYYTKITGIPSNYSIWSYNRANVLVTDIVGVPWSSSAVEVTDSVIAGMATLDDEGLQKITVVIKQGSDHVLTLEIYKVK